MTTSPQKNNTLAKIWREIKRLFRKAVGKESNRLPKLPKEFVDYRYVYMGQEGSEVIRATLCKDQPCLIARHGTTELNTVKYFLENKSRNNCVFSETIKNNIATLSGFFPTDDNFLIRFSCEFLRAIQSIDILGVRVQEYEKCFFDLEEPFIVDFSPKATLVDIVVASPVLTPSPWMQVLKNKKVLVIHPFEATIKSQYQKRELLFKNPDLFLPQFELKTIKAVQSLADEKDDLPFKSWFEALDFMYQQIDEIDFDIALIGAGAYGVFLGKYCKLKGKKAVHVGGALQILFGIRGKRYDDAPAIAALYNEHWVYPSSEDRPKGANKVEDGCYWQ